MHVHVHVHGWDCLWFCIPEKRIDRTIPMKKNENSNEQEMENRTKAKKTTDIQTWYTIVLKSVLSLSLDRTLNVLCTLG